MTTASLGLKPVGRRLDPRGQAGGEGLAVDAFGRHGGLLCGGGCGSGMAAIYRAGEAASMLAGL